MACNNGNPRTYFLGLPRNFGELLAWKALGWNPTSYLCFCRFSQNWYPNVNIFIQSSHCFWLWFQFLLDERSQTHIYSPAPVCIAKKSWQCRQLNFRSFRFFYPSFLGHLHLACRLCLIDLIAFQARSNFSIPNQHISDTLPLDVQSKDSNQFFRLGQVLRNDSSPNSEFQSTFKHWTNWWTVTSVSFTFHSPVQVSTSANRLLSQAHL